MNVNVINPLSARTNNSFKGNTLQVGREGNCSAAFSAAFEKVKMDRYTGDTSFAAAGLLLSDNDYNYLSSKWNPNKMTQDEYDEFLDYLQDKGIISEEDKECAGYGGHFIRHTTLNEGSCYSCYSCYSLERPFRAYADGDVLAYVRYESSLIYEPSTPEREYEVNLHKKIFAIMEGMVRQRGK